MPTPVTPLTKFENAFENLSVYSGRPYKGKGAPHKACMLLAVIDAIAAGEISSNEIPYDPKFLQHYHQYFEQVTGNLESKSYYPFVHLDTEEFWNLQLKPGSDPITNSDERHRLATRSGRVAEFVDSARLNDELYDYLSSDPAAREHLRTVLTKKWLHGHERELESIRARWMAEMSFARDVDDTPQNQEWETELNDGSAEYWHRINRNRDPKFRQAVLRAYNYTCAATGWRLEVPDHGPLLEAAHIYPLHLRENNDPPNGIALTPTIHSAMDAHLVAPGPDRRWHASGQLKSSAKFDQGAEFLLQLDNKEIILPDKVQFHPYQASLEWRMDNLRK